MAEIFFYELLQTSNSLQSDVQDREYVMCRQETVKMSREKVLPSSNYACPAVMSLALDVSLSGSKRITLAPFAGGSSFQQPRPCLEYGIAEGQDDDHNDGWEEEEEEEDHTDDNDDHYHHHQNEEDQRQRLLGSICETYCVQLDLDDNALNIAQRIIKDLSHLSPFRRLQMTVSTLAHSRWSRWVYILPRVSQVNLGLLGRYVGSQICTLVSLRVFAFTVVAFEVFMTMSMTEGSFSLMTKSCGVYKVALWSGLLLILTRCLTTSSNATETCPR